LGVWGWGWGWGTWVCLGRGRDGLIGLIAGLTAGVVTRRVRARLGLRPGGLVAVCGAPEVVGHDTAGYQSVAIADVPR
jgi:hypothetical protein